MTGDERDLLPRCGAKQTGDDGVVWLCDEHAGHLGLHGTGGLSWCSTDAQIAQWKLEGRWGYGVRRGGEA